MLEARARDRLGDVGDICGETLWRGQHRCGESVPDDEQRGVDKHCVGSLAIASLYPTGGPTGGT